jgi:hypothetical protein
MAKCDYCGTSIFMGGVRNGQQHFCNNKCAQGAYILSVSQNIPADVMERKIEEVWRGNCPKCNGTGPVDVHKSYQIWSAVVLTRYSTNTQVSCRSCATKRQAGALAMSLVFGWWGFPWGLIITPVQVTRNIVDMINGPQSAEPSPELRKMVKVNIGAQILAKQKTGGVPPGMAAS